jgi:hypothetical protein
VEPLPIFCWALSPVPYISNKDRCLMNNVGDDGGGGDFADPAWFRLGPFGFAQDTLRRKAQDDTGGGLGMIIECKQNPGSACSPHA